MKRAYVFLTFWREKGLGGSRGSEGAGAFRPLNAKAQSGWPLGPGLLSLNLCFVEFAFLFFLVAMRAKDCLRLRTKISFFPRMDL
jgi:hypothetical protein